MNSRRPSTRFLTLPVAAVVYILLTSTNLPPIVASHFNASGEANSFMSREFYTGFMLVFLVSISLLLVYAPAFFFNRPNAKINVPNREYWLAPERRQDTIDFLCLHIARYAVVVVLLFCYVHWLVIQANAQDPPKLSSPSLTGGLAVFLILTIIWAGTVLVRFRRKPPAAG